MSFDVPDGFAVRTHGREVLVADPALAQALLRLGLGTRAGWEERLRGTCGHAGRGGTARVELPAGPVLRIKQLRRGGWVGSLWRERYAGRRRPLHNLSAPAEALRRGIATARAHALLLVPGPPGFVRAWLGVEDVSGACDLASGTRETGLPVPVEIEAAVRLVRHMHDRGLEHRDLNLGNLLVRRRGPEEVQAFVVDLDSARLHPGPVPFGSRQRDLRRLERSLVKLGACGEPLEQSRERIYAEYAADDAALARRLARGRGAGRLRIAVHRLAWRQ